MSKISDFYAKAMADESAKAKLEAILGGKEFSEASEEELTKIGELAKELGYEITLEEVKEFLNPAEAELEDDDLDTVAGGKGGGGSDGGNTTVGGDCVNGVGGINTILNL